MLAGGGAIWLMAHIDDFPNIDYVASLKKGDAAPLPKERATVALPDTDDIGELCRAATPSAIRRLITIALSTESESTAIQAIRELNDRGWGKAAQTIIQKGTDQKVIEDMLAEFRKLPTPLPVIDLIGGTIGGTMDKPSD